MSVPKQHHLTPEFLLDRFANSEGKIVLVHREDRSRTFPSTPHNALKQGYFYTFDLEDGTRSHDVETKLLAKVEADAAYAIERVIDKRVPSSRPGLRAKIATFMAFQYVRGERTRESTTAQYSAVAKSILAAHTDETLSASLREMFKELTVEESREIAGDLTRMAAEHEIVPAIGDDPRKGAASNHLALILPTVLELVPFFVRRAWVILEYDALALVTGDEPVALVSESCRLGEPMGIYNAPQIVFATDPRHALVLVRRDLQENDGRHAAASGSEKVINEAVAYRCHRFIAHNPDHDPLRELNIPEPGRSITEVVTDSGHYVLTHGSPVSAEHSGLPPWLEHEQAISKGSRSPR